MDILLQGQDFTDSNGAVSNSKMTEFKDFAANPNPTKIFDCFVGVFVEDWLDAILGLVNNVISSKGSEFEKNLPIITGLLNSVGVSPKQVLLQTFSTVSSRLHVTASTASHLNRNQADL